MPRDNVPKAIEMMPKIEALGGETEVKLTALAPVCADGMDSVMISYWFKSTAALGNAIDNIGMPEEYQSIVTQASELGRLLRSRIVTMI
jgi:hypothetical protein